MKKKFFARALALVMSLSLLSTVAFAAPVAFDPDWHVDEDGSLLAHKEEQADGTFSQSYDYYLDKDIELDKTLTIKDGANASIDLNGYNLSLNKELKVDTDTAKVEAPEDAKIGSVIEVTGEGTSLTVTDNSDGANGTISGGYNPGVSPAGFGGGIKVDGNASLDLQGGTITNNVAANGGGVYVGKGTVEMSGDAKIDGNLAIMNGGGVFLNTELASRTDDEAVFTMNGGTISNNTASGKDANGNIVGGGGGIGAVLYKESPDPEYNAIVVNGGTITGNKAEVGGAGIYVTNGKVSITDATISGNIADNIQGTGTTQSGGGIFITGNKSSLTISGNTVISGNEATQGGGVYAQGSANITMGDTTIPGTTTITGNSADIRGGGVFLYGDGTTFTMNNGIISGNTSHGANYGGGGVYSWSGTTFIMNDGEITGNTAQNGHGGGVFNHTATFTMTGGKLYNNGAGTSSDDVFSNTSSGGSLKLVKASGALENQKPISGWYWDDSAGWGNETGKYPYTNQDHVVGGTYKGILRLKAAHDQYFSVLDGENNTELANVEKGTVLDLSTIEAPQLDGYAFIGWVLGDEVVESVTVTEEITLGSLWQHVDHNTATRTENMIPAQIGVAGSYDEVTYCTVCGDELGRTTVTIPALEPEEPETPEDPGVIIPDPDVPLAGGPDTGDTATIEDEAVPLAGIVTLAEMLEELRQREEIAEIELPEDFKFIDHDYAQALYWALAEDLVADTEEEPLDPDEIVTVGLMKKVLDSYVGVYKSYEDFVVAVEGEPDELVMDLGERLTAFYGELEQYETAAEAEAETK